MALFAQTPPRLFDPALLLHQPAEVSATSAVVWLRLTYTDQWKRWLAIARPTTAIPGVTYFGVPVEFSSFTAAENSCISRKSHFCCSTCNMDGIVRQLINRLAYDATALH